MVTPSSDSHVSITQPRSQKRPAATTSDTDLSNHTARDESQKSKKRTAKKKPAAPKRTQVPNGGAKGNGKKSAAGKEQKGFTTTIESYTAFQYSNNKALLYGKRWSADKYKKLYLILKTAFFDDLEKLDTKFTLSMMFGQQRVIAFIVNAGLEALSLKTLPPGKTKESVLGFFPVLGRLLEEEENIPIDPSTEIQSASNPHTVTVGVLKDKDYKSQNTPAKATENSSEAKPKKTLKLKGITKKLDV
ncbi:hypothetical protein PGTUg99_014364 [Puccinia graminis f. sp. tritici]|uniref:Uncharacterized protein n=1 Tax=Puccinia graminis f. sp. tritici TaxID=56615 RepID=A0A5B0SES7_PUCGR|nr:hypothetical protein PGTUg99_014364 [Puccinia graminis f. sp. tritici]